MLNFENPVNLIFIVLGLGLQNISMSQLCPTKPEWVKSTDDSQISESKFSPPNFL